MGVCVYVCVRACVRACVRGLPVASLLPSRFSRMCDSVEVLPLPKKPASRVTGGIWVSVACSVASMLATADRRLVVDTDRCPPALPAPAVLTGVISRGSRWRWCAVGIRRARTPIASMAIESTRRPVIRTPTLAIETAALTSQGARVASGWRCLCTSISQVIIQAASSLLKQARLAPALLAGVPSSEQVAPRKITALCSGHVS